MVVRGASKVMTYSSSPFVLLSSTLFCLFQNKRGGIPLSMSIYLFFNLLVWRRVCALSASSSCVETRKREFLCARLFFVAFAHLVILFSDDEKPTCSMKPWNSCVSQREGGRSWGTWGMKKANDALNSLLFQIYVADFCFFLLLSFSLLFPGCHRRCWTHTEPRSTSKCIKALMHMYT